MDNIANPVRRYPTTRIVGVLPSAKLEVGSCRYRAWFRALNDIARYSTGSCQGSYERGHARIALKTHETLCTLCIFGSDVNMKVKSAFQGSFMVDVELECN